MLFSAYLYLPIFAYNLFFCFLAQKKFELYVFELTAINYRMLDCSISTSGAKCFILYITENNRTRIRSPLFTGTYQE